jgi:hypothetical protein
VEAEKLDEAVAALPAVGQEEARITVRTLWNALPVLACLVGLLVLDWIGRKSRNMA